MVSEKQQWEFRSFSEICEVRKEKFDPKDNPDQPYIGLEHIEQRTGSISGIGSSKDTTSMKSVFKKNDVLFGKLRPYLRKYWYSSFNGVCATEVLPLVTKNNFESKYLFYLVQSNPFINYLSNRAFGTRMPRTSWNEIAEYETLIPLNIKEQQKIAAILSSVDEAIEKTEQIIEQTEQVKKGLMQQLLTKGIRHTRYKKTSLGEIPECWKVLTIEDIVQKEKGSIKIGPFGSQLKKDFLVKEGYKVYGQENVYQDDFTLGERYVDYARFDKLKTCQIEAGDFLITMMGTIGKCTVVPNKIEPGIMDSHLLKLRLDPNIYDAYLLKHSLMSSLVQNQIERLSVGGIMAGLSSKVIKQISLPIPPIKEQKEIEDILSKVDEKKENENGKLVQLQNTKQGLMQQLLTGKVRVPIDNEEVVET